MMKKDIILIKAREHQIKYVENIEDIRMGYVDALLQKHNFSTCIVDLAFCQNNPLPDEEKIRKYIEENTPKIIIFFIDKHPTNGPAYTIELVDKLSDSGSLDEICVAVYGNTQIDIETFFRHKVDCVILGEEDSALSLVKGIFDSDNYENIDGIAYLDKENKVCITPSTIRNDLDDLPFPTRYALKQIEVSNYSASILASRGCFGKCTYCYLRSKEKYFGSYPLRLRSIKNIVDEIETLYKKGITEFYFADDEFLQPGSIGIVRATNFAKELAKRNISIRYSIYARADCVNEELVAILSKTGLYCVFLGIESFSQSVLDRYNKGTTVDSNINAIRILQTYDIHVRMGMIMFDMMTTPEELWDSISVLKEIMQYKPELLFQSMFFSNALIPLNDTPATRLMENTGDTNLFPNSFIQQNYERRSRSGKQKYLFKSKEVSNIYTCTEVMATRLLEKCIKDENKLYLQGYSFAIVQRLMNITKFAVDLLEVIYTDVMNDRTVDECLKEINAKINMYYSDEK